MKIRRTHECPARLLCWLTRPPADCFPTPTLSCPPTSSFFSSTALGKATLGSIRCCLLCSRPENKNNVSVLSEADGDLCLTFSCSLPVALPPSHPTTHSEPVA